MIDANKGSVLFADCEGFLTELSITDEAVLSGGKGKKGRSSRSSVSKASRRSATSVSRPARRRRRRAKARKGGFSYKH